MHTKQLSLMLKNQMFATSVKSTAMRASCADPLSMAEVLQRVRRGSITSKVDCGLKDSLHQRLSSAMKRATEGMQAGKDKDQRRTEQRELIRIEKNAIFNLKKFEKPKL